MNLCNWSNNPNNIANNIEKVKWPTILPMFCSDDIIIESWEVGENVADIFELHRNHLQKCYLNID